MSAFVQPRPPTVVDSTSVDDGQAPAAARRVGPAKNGTTTGRVAAVWQGRTHTRAPVEAR